jgi:hypothetical protein
VAGQEIHALTWPSMVRLVQAASTEPHNFKSARATNTAWALPPDSIAAWTCCLMVHLQRRQLPPNLGDPNHCGSGRCGRWSPLNMAERSVHGAPIERRACAMDFSASQLRQLFQSMMWLGHYDRLPQLYALSCSQPRHGWSRPAGPTNRSRTQLVCLVRSARFALMPAASAKTDDTRRIPLQPGDQKAGGGG